MRTALNLGERRRPLLASLVFAVATSTLLSVPGADAAERRTSALPALAMPATADGQLPQGWRLTLGPAGVRLSWLPPAPLPLVDARTEFRLGKHLLGYPRLAPDGRLILALGGLPAGDLSRLAVWRSGQRLDRAGTATTTSTPVTAPPMMDTRRSLDVDPGERGRWRTRSSDYTLPDITVPDFETPVEVVGHVVAPRKARGARPLVLFLHGAHGTCFSAASGRLDTTWPCRPDDTPVPNHLGYSYLQRLLASQGYVTVSISANGINGQEFGLSAEDFGATQRSALVRHHLRLWARWADGGGRDANRWAGRVDMDRVLLMGTVEVGRASPARRSTPPPTTSPAPRGSSCEWSTCPRVRYERRCSLCRRVATPPSPRSRTNVTTETTSTSRSTPCGCSCIAPS